MRLLLRLPTDSFVPAQTPAQEASCETLRNTLMSTPISAMITAASVPSTPGISCSKASFGPNCEFPIYNFEQWAVLSGTNKFNIIKGITVIPEPGTAALVVTGLGLLACPGMIRYPRHPH